jgi:hypothetical protein
LYSKPGSRSWRICISNDLPGARAKSLRLGEEKRGSLSGRFQERRHGKYHAIKAI